MSVDNINKIKPAINVSKSLMAFLGQTRNAYQKVGECALLY